MRKSTEASEMDLVIDNFIDIGFNTQTISGYKINSKSPSSAKKKDADLKSVLTRPNTSAPMESIQEKPVPFSESVFTQFEEEEDKSNFSPGFSKRLSEKSEGSPDKLNSQNSKPTSTTQSNQNKSKNNKNMSSSKKKIKKFPINSLFDVPKHKILEAEKLLNSKKSEVSPSKYQIKSLFDIPKHRILKAKKLLESPKKNFKMKSLFDVSEYKLKEAEKLLNSQKSKISKEKKGAKLKLNSLFNVSRANLEKAKLLFSSQESTSPKNSIHKNKGNPKQKSKKPCLDKHKSSKPRLSKRSKYTKPVKKVNTHLNSMTRKTHRASESRQRRKTINLKKKPSKNLPEKKINNFDSMLDSLVKISNVKKNLTLDQCILDEMYNLRNASNKVDLKKINRIFKTHFDTKFYRVKMKEFGVHLSKITEGWLQHHLKMISYKLETMKKCASLAISLKKTREIILEQLLFRYWKEYKKRSDSVLFKLLKREIKSTLPVVLRLNHIEFISNTENSLRLYFSDGWYLVYHQISIDHEWLDWKKIYHILNKIESKTNPQTQKEEIQKIRAKITQMVDSRLRPRSITNTNKFKNDLELLLLIITGKLSVEKKVLLTGLEFAQEISAEKLADSDPYDIDGHVVININTINPLPSQDVKLGQYKKDLLPTELGVGFRKK